MPRKKKPARARAAAPKAKPKPGPAGSSTAGVRAVQAHFAAYLRRVKDGESVSITERGQVIAQLTPPSPAVAPRETIKEMHLRLERTGQVARPSVSMEEFRAILREPPPGHGLPKGTMQRILDEDREDRF
jgi:prevent-host-death family protein